MSGRETAPGSASLPDGTLIAWYGDDFTGAAAVMEAMTFAGLPATLFFDTPTPEQLARFPGMRGIGIAGIARSRPPEWMREALPPIYKALRATGAPILQYKLCTTFDSSPEIGSIGTAIEVGLEVTRNQWVPLLTAAPPMRRFQAFGNLFATVGETTYRIDRHPVMSRHPVTPMHEGDLGRHLAQQTQLPIGLVDLAAMKSGQGVAALTRALEAGSRIVSLDVLDEETLIEAGRLIWEHREGPQLVAASQGLEYALVAYWRHAGLLPAMEETRPAPAVKHIAVVSGSCSPVTAEQIGWAEAHGFRGIPLDPSATVDEARWAAERARVVAAGLAALSEGQDPLIYSARGPEDASTVSLHDVSERSGVPLGTLNDRLGDGLGRVLGGVMEPAGLTRGVIAGGDTSGHAALALGVYALSALAPVVHGAALCRAHSETPAQAGLELALKGGQMGGPDYFGRIRNGGAAPSGAAA